MNQYYENMYHDVMLFRKKFGLPIADAPEGAGD